MRVTLFLNHACNLRCTYCYNGEKFQRRMPVDVMRRGIDLALEAPTHPSERTQISFFGGEPLLEMELIEEGIAYAIERAERWGRKLIFHVMTNGTTLTRDVMDRLLAANVQIGVSLDGCEAAHDATRRYVNGRSSYADIVGNVRALADRVPPGGFRIMSVVDPANVEWLANSFDSLLDLGAADLRVNLNYTGHWDDLALERFSTSLRALGDRYIDAFRRGKRFQLGLLDAKIMTHLKGGYTDCDRCDFGCEEIAVAPSGRLYPCDRLVGMDDRDELVIGDVVKGVDAARRDALIAEKNTEAPECAQCELARRCMHWCGCVNHAMTGKLGEVSGLLCWFEQHVTEEADRCASTLYAERNPVFMERFYPPAMPGLLRVVDS